MKEQLNLEFLKECSFKPHLYPKPKSIIPTYRGQPRLRTDLVLVSLMFLGASKHTMDDPNVSSIDHVHQTPSMLSTGQFGESLQFNSTANSSSSNPHPITISRLSQSNIAKALLSYDQQDDHRHPAPSDSDKYTEYTEEIVNANQPSHKDTPLNTLQPTDRQKSKTRYPSNGYLLSDDDDERIDDLPTPPPPFSILTSSFTIQDLQDDQAIPPPPVTPPPPPYHYSTTGETVVSPQQQSVIQRIQSKKSSSNNIL